MAPAKGNSILCKFSVCGSVLQCVAVFFSVFSVLQCVAVCCSVLQSFVVCRRVFTCYNAGT